MTKIKTARKSKTDHEIVLTLTPFEASVVSRVLMNKVRWAPSNEFGSAACDIYAALADEGVIEAEWGTVDQENPTTWSKL